MSANKPKPQEIVQTPGLDEEKKVLLKDDQIPSQVAEPQSGELKPDTPK